MVKQAMRHRVGFPLVADAKRWQEHEKNKTDEDDKQESGAAVIQMFHFQRASHAANSLGRR